MHNQDSRNHAIHFWIACFVIFTLVNAVVRCVLVGLSLPQAQYFSMQTIAALLMGAVNDVAIGVLLSSVFFVGLHLLKNFWNRIVGKTVAIALFLSTLIVLNFTALAEVIFWNEFDSRFNTTAVYYLIFPREVLGNIKESFDLSLLLPPVFVGAIVLFFLMKRKFFAALNDKASLAQVKKPVLLAGMLAVVSALYIWMAPVYSFESRQLNQIAESGYHTFLASLIHRKTEYHGIYPGLAANEAQQTLQSTLVQQNTAFLSQEKIKKPTLRHVTPVHPVQKKNVVLVIEESFGSVYYDDMGPKVAQMISPNLHKIAEKGMFFSNIYSTGDRTVRGLEALLTSFAPIPGISTVRRPEHDQMYSLPWVLGNKGYETAFLYAGHSGFDNMRQYWDSIGFHHVWEQDDIKDQGFTTVWGVADEYLFKEALKRMDEHTKKDKPFFLSMLTTTNHRPFVYPKGRIQANPDDKQRENAAAYADWSLGQFIEKAKSHDWFDDTIFVIIGDHGPKVFGHETVPIQAFRVPLVFYAPGEIVPSRHNVTGSSLDVAPTLLGLLGLEYDSPFFGRDLQLVQADDGRASMSYNFTVAYAQNDEVTILKPNGPSEAYRIAKDHLSLKREDHVPLELERKAIAQTQTAYDMFYSHNYHFN
ncbi:LTA synthase family protein [Terasakiella sp.]|uniref:LTA synthase family protein n=1 Tax=Terasakiella sp. TaxID=2034861 RepID=UPI003AA96921